MEEKLLATIINQSFTQAEALRHLRSLKEFLVNKLFTSGGKTTEPVEEENAWILALGEEFLKQFDKKNIYRLFEETEATIKKIPLLVIYVAVEIPESEVTALGTKIRQTYGNEFLLEIKLDPGLIAGASLVWNGVYKDYSIRKKIADNREIILNSLKTYANR